MPIDDQDEVTPGVTPGSGRAIEQTWGNLHPEDAVANEDEDMDPTEALDEGDADDLDDEDEDDLEDDEEEEDAMDGGMTGDPVERTGRRDPFLPADEL